MKPRHDHIHAQLGEINTHATIDAITLQQCNVVRIPSPSVLLYCRNLYLLLSAECRSREVDDRGNCGKEEMSLLECVLFKVPASSTQLQLLKHILYLNCLSVFVNVNSTLCNLSLRY